MQTDDWRAIEADPIYKNASPEKRAAMAAIYKHAKAKKPLVLKSEVDPPKRQHWAEMKPAPATLADEVRGMMPEFPGEDPVQASMRENRLRNPPAPGVANRLVRSVREAIPGAAKSGISSGWLADAHRNALTASLPPVRRPVNLTPLVTKAAQNQTPPAAEPGLVDAVRDVAREPSRLLPGSPGWVEGVGAAAPHVAAATIDPAGAYAGGAVFKAAAPVVKGAAKVAGQTAKAVADIPIPPKALEMARRIIAEEEGQAVPGWLGASAKATLDAADGAFEAGGQAAMRGAETVGTVTKAALNTAASKMADGGQQLGDALHKPKVWAEDAASTVASKVDLKGRTGKTADEWYQTAKNEPATTPYPVANSLLDATRRVMVSDFGMTPEMKAIRESGRVYGNNAARPLEDVAVRLNKERTGDEQFNIHWQATEKTPPPGPMNPQTIFDASDVKNASRAADRALEDVGALPDGMTDLYDGTHLPRGYAKHWFAEGKKNPFNDTPDNKIGGFYQRGLNETVSENEYLVRRTNASLSGEDWRVVSKNPDGSVNLHRDWTIPEREVWGEIRNASSALQRKAIKTKRDASSAYILDAYAKPGAGDARGPFAIRPPAFSAGVPSGSSQRVLPKTMEMNGQKYVLLDNRTAGESGIPKYGRLANHYVREDVAFYLWNENTLKPFVNNLNKYTMNNLWKKMVTIGNFPGYFVNNFFQNPLILERTGGTMADMPAAWAKMASNDIDIQRLEDAGVIRNGVLARELGSQLQHFNATLSSQHMHDGFSISKQIFRAMNALKSYEQNGYKLAGASDDLYRVALVEGLMRREGKSFEEAADIAKKAFYDSDAVTAPAAQVASTFAPFTKVLWWAANNEAEAWTKNPGKAAYVNFLVSAMPVAASYAMGKNWSQQDAEQLALPPNAQGHGNNFPTPYTDDQGRSYYVDASNWNHYNQFKPMDNTALSVKLPVNLPIHGDMVGVPRGLAPGGPVASLAQLAFNTDAFTGKPIVDRGEITNDAITDNRLNYLARNLTPGIVRNGMSMYDIITGDGDDDKAQPSKTAKVLRTLTGVKLRPADIPNAVRVNRIKRSKEEQKIDKASRKAETPKEKQALAKQKLKAIEESQSRHRRLTKNSLND